MAKVSGCFHAVIGEHLFFADLAHVAPFGVGDREEAHGEVVVVAGVDRVRHVAAGKNLTVFVEYLFGRFGGGDDYGVDAAEVDGHEGAVRFGEFGERLVRPGAELEHVSDYWKRFWARREVFWV